MNKFIKNSKTPLNSFLNPYGTLAIVSVVCIVFLSMQASMMKKLTTLSKQLIETQQQLVQQQAEKPPAEQTVSNTAYQNIRDLIVQRAIVKDDDIYGVSLSDQLTKDIKEYNVLVPRLKGLFAEKAVRTMISLLMMEAYHEGEFHSVNCTNYLDLPADLRAYAEIVADLSLYKNCTELLCNDSRLAFIISTEGGGSAGLWPYLWHTEYLNGQDDIKEDLYRLFELTERMILALGRTG